MPTRNGKALNEHEHRFVDSFMGIAAGNATQAAIQAGYSRRSARAQASRLLTRANIQAALAERIRCREQQSIASADERDLLLSEILRSKETSTADRIRAVAELNKCSGRHSSVHHHKGRLTLEELLGQSRE